MKTIGRDKIRKKPLDPECYAAEISRQEDGKIYCYGYIRKIDGMHRRWWKCGYCPAMIENKGKGETV